jgi:TPR repeat protein
MTSIFKSILLTILCLILSNCTLMRQECSELAGDVNAFRQCSANQGDRQSQFELGYMAYDIQDYETALKWFKRAAMPQRVGKDLFIESNNKSQTIPSESYGRDTTLPGHKGAQKFLADMYEQGLGVEIDLKKAEEYRTMR